MRCPGFEQLIDSVDPLAAPAGAGSVESHLASGCERCDDDLGWYAQVTSVAAGDDSVEPPSWVTKRAFSIFETGRSRRRLVEMFGRVVASLVFDSASQPALSFARSASPAPRQLLYQACEFSIDLQVESQASKAGLTGQILRDGEFLFESVSGLPLTLVRNGKPALSTETNERGEFRISAVKPGNYDLRIDTPEVEITIVGLKLTRQ